MAFFATRGKVFLSRFQPKVPEQLKSGKLARIAKYFQNIAGDYRAAVTEMIADMQSRPGKTGVWLSLVAAAGTLAKTNPSETSFHVAVAESAHDLLLLGEVLRSRTSDNHVQAVLQASVEGTLRYTNCMLFSVVWIAACSPVVDTYKAQCKLVRPRWSEIHRRIVDVGVLGRWHRLHWAMQDYDVNIDEWDEEGKKKSLADKQNSRSLFKH